MNSGSKQDDSPVKHGRLATYGNRTSCAGNSTIYSVWVLTDTIYRAYFPSTEVFGTPRTRTALEVAPPIRNVTCGGSNKRSICFPRLKSGRGLIYGVNAYGTELVSLVSLRIQLWAAAGAEPAGSLCPGGRSSGSPRSPGPPHAGGL